MIDGTSSINRVATVVLLFGIVFILGPVAVAIVTATQSFEQFIANGGISITIGGSFINNLGHIVTETRLPQQLLNSVVVAILVAGVKCSFAFTATFALVFFESRWNKVIFALTVATVMLPLELIVITTYQIVSNIAMPLNWILDLTGLGWVAERMTGTRPYIEWNLLGSYVGIAAPIATASTSVFVYRQFFLSLPKDLSRAAAMDGAGPIRFMIDILLPLSRTPLVATFLFWFIGAWTSYLWPLVAATTPDAQTAIVGLAKLSTYEPDRTPDVPVLMAGALFVSFLPVVLIAALQGLIVRGMNLSEK
ncbi:sn-glycerol-3-phosphate ABC transporter permease protein UgpE 1 (plasmid) [Rhizobium etli 8C-3]|uniref:sn-glycerol-3-phosphate transport system permease protein UgpE n=1 Tax=Rhizobium etli 8C-3 TaxID=538025 RepID=A0A1L5PAQ5_RHIET|nr:carbohydrate ABC transporter permease [Rhizobium etli]APO77204.1 sn-glycerol-3-phosphate ABC transporter permease protein UgpE 1 [Rhizobium etli 8C-3]